MFKWLSNYTNVDGTAYRPDDEVSVAVGGIEQLVDAVVSVVLSIPIGVTPVGRQKLAHGIVADNAVPSTFNKPIAGVELPHFGVAVLVENGLRPEIVAVLPIADFDLGGVFIDDVFKTHRLLCGKNVLRERE